MLSKIEFSHVSRRWVETHLKVRSKTAGKSKVRAVDGLIDFRDTSCTGWKSKLIGEAIKKWDVNWWMGEWEKLAGHEMDAVCQQKISAVVCLDYINDQQYESSWLTSRDKIPQATAFFVEARTYGSKTNVQGANKEDQDARRRWGKSLTVTNPDWTYLLLKFEYIGIVKCNM